MENYRIARSKNVESQYRREKYKNIITSYDCPLSTKSLKPYDLQKFAAVVLAAGEGVRFAKAYVPKVLQVVDGKPIVCHTIDQLLGLNIPIYVSVKGRFVENISKFLKENYSFKIQIRQYEPQTSKVLQIVDIAQIIKPDLYDEEYCWGYDIEATGAEPERHVPKRYLITLHGDSIYPPLALEDAIRSALNTLESDWPCYPKDGYRPKAAIAYTLKTFTPNSLKLIPGKRFSSEKGIVGKFKQESCEDELAFCVFDIHKLTNIDPPFYNSRLPTREELFWLSKESEYFIKRGLLKEVYEEAYVSEPWQYRDTPDAFYAHAESLNKNLNELQGCLDFESEQKVLENMLKVGGRWRKSKIGTGYTWLLNELMQKGCDVLLISRPAHYLNINRPKDYERANEFFPFLRGELYKVETKSTELKQLKPELELVYWKMVLPETDTTHYSRSCYEKYEEDEFNTDLVHVIKEPYQSHRVRHLINIVNGYRNFEQISDDKYEEQDFEWLETQYPPHHIKLILEYLYTLTNPQTQKPLPKSQTKIENFPKRMIHGTE